MSVRIGGCYTLRAGGPPLLALIATVASGAALAQVKVSTLVLIGGRDQPHLIEAGETAARDIPGARKVVYPAAGHLINMEEPKRFNRDLEAFLASLPR